jgi:Protein of unknown function (DUF4233)
MDEPRPPRPPRSARRMFATTVLLLEVLVVFFAALVAYGLRLADPAAIAVASGGVALLAVLAVGLLRSSAGYVLGSALQVWVLASGLVVPAMYVLGGLFTLLWVVGLRLGTRIDRERAARWAAEQAGSAEAVGLAEQGRAGQGQDAR